MKMKQKVMTLTLGALLSASLIQSESLAASIQVEKGNTLWNLSKKHNVDIDTIKSLNNLTSNNIYIGQTLNISANSTEVKKQPTGAIKKTTDITYIVKKGDTLSRIGKAHGVAYQTIKKWNNLTSDTIRIGQRITIQASSEKTSIISSQAASPVVKSAVKGVSNTGINELLSFAKDLIGTPYKWGGTSPSGFDCSGFIYYVLKNNGQISTRLSVSAYWSSIDKVSKPVPGDLVFFQNTYKSGPSHMGIYLGDNSFIHAGSKGIEVAKVNSSYWGKHFLGYGTTY